MIDNSQTKSITAMYINMIQEKILQNTNDVKDQETKFRTNTTQKHKYTI
jgi:hypothetical protein